jgi:gamma-glutamylcyclotransferase
LQQWYFAYGSNLLKEQMIHRTGSLGDAEHPPRLARLAWHRLVFERLESGGPAYANIRPSHAEVLGVLYCCTSEALKRLDSFEEGYERRTVEVTDSQGETVGAIAYFMREGAGKQIPGRPSDEYLVRIITGAKEHGLPEPYLSTVIALAQSDPERG